MKLEKYLEKNNIIGDFWLQSTYRGKESFVLVNADNREDVLRWQGECSVKKVEPEEGELTTIFI